MSNADRCYITYLVETDNRYKYIARDRNGSMWVFKSKPDKIDGLWRVMDNTSYFQVIPSNNLMTFVQVGDTAPTSIEYLYRFIQGSYEKPLWVDTTKKPRSSDQEDRSVDVLCRTSDGGSCVGYADGNSEWYNSISGEHIQVAQWKYIEGILTTEQAQGY